MKTYGILVLLLVDLFFSSANGYLTTAEVNQDRPQANQHSSAKSSPSVSSPSSGSAESAENDLSKCPSGGACSKLPADCFTCAYHHNCTYGENASFTCKVKKGVHCVNASGKPTFNLTVKCQFCWQLDPSEYRCNISTSCMTVSCPRKRYNTTCKVLDHVNCIGMDYFLSLWYLAGGVFVLPHTDRLGG
ncbi:hypothetical protein NFI96_032151 [Prochilodus magdalenae]|nr:hypothetical protein NFI96_032151 [Prochilodus magdalenae]